MYSGETMTSTRLWFSVLNLSQAGGTGIVWQLLNVYPVVVRVLLSFLPLARVIITCCSFINIVLPVFVGLSHCIDLHWHGGTT